MQKRPGVGVESVGVLPPVNLHHLRYQVPRRVPSESLTIHIGGHWWGGRYAVSAPHRPLVPSFPRLGAEVVPPRP